MLEIASTKEHPMFEVVIKRTDGETETYDALDEMQATFILFRAKSKPTTESVVMNEVVDIDDVSSLTV